MWCFFCVFFVVFFNLTGVIAVALEEKKKWSSTFVDKPSFILFYSFSNLFQPQVSKSHVLWGNYQQQHIFTKSMKGLLPSFTWLIKLPNIIEAY